MEEYLRTLKVVILKKLCEVYSITGLIIKRELVEALCQKQLEMCEIEEQIEVWETEKREEAREAQKREEALEAEKRRELERQNLREAREHELALARIAAGLYVPTQIILDKGVEQGKNCTVAQENGYEMTEILRPFKEDLLLVNIERDNESVTGAEFDCRESDEIVDEAVTVGIPVDEPEQNDSKLWEGETSQLMLDKSGKPELELEGYELPTCKELTEMSKEKLISLQREDANLNPLDSVEMNPYQSSDQLGDCYHEICLPGDLEPKFVNSGIILGKLGVNLEIRKRIGIG